MASPLIDEREHDEDPLVPGAHRVVERPQRGGFPRDVEELTAGILGELPGATDPEPRLDIPDPDGQVHDHVVEG